MSKFLNREIKTIFIMLGAACNLQCKYCMQHDIVCEPISNKINMDVIEFIKEKAAEQENPVDIRFYGGEPLLYYDNIKTIVNNLKGENVKYSIISNGKLLNQEIVKFFNLHNFNVAISWDGRNVAKTRKYDVFTEKKELLMQLNHLCISGVLSSYNYVSDFITSIEEIEKDYSSQKGYGVGFSIDEIMDMGLGDKSLTNIKFVKMKDQMENLCLEVEKFLQGDNNVNQVKVRYIYSLINRLRCKNRSNAIMACGNGYDVLNVDLEGNLYKCHNTHIKVGTIYDDYFVYLGNVIENDETRFNYEEKCKSCSVQALCKNGCALVKSKARETSYCELKKSIFEPVINLIDKYMKGEII